MGYPDTIGLLAASLPAQLTSNRLDYSVTNSFRRDPTELEVINDKCRNIDKSSKIPAAQNNETQRSTRGRGSSKQGCHRGSGQTSDQHKTAIYSSSSNLPQYISRNQYKPYITDEEWCASADELKELIEIEKSILRRKCLLSELASIRAENAGNTAGLFSGGSSRQQDYNVTDPCDIDQDLNFERSSSHAENSCQSSSASSDEYTVLKENRGKRRKPRKTNTQAKCSEYSLTSSDEHKGENNIMEQFIKIFPQHLLNRDAENSKYTSGIHDSVSNDIVSKQRFPHSQLQQEYLYDVDGENVVYHNLSFGLFVAGEMEIISDPLTDPKEAIRRQELLKITAYRSRYIPWPKLLHLHAAILQKIESGRATWESNFDSIEKMVLENPDHLANNESELGHHNSAMQQRVFWCWNFNKSTCDMQHQHPERVNGKHVSVKHICATCHYHEKVERAHSESSNQCPWFSGSNDEAQE